MELIQLVNNHFNESIKAKSDAQSILAPLVIEASQLIVNSLVNENGKVLVCGNGGSAADAQHFAAELVGRFERERYISLPAIALTTDTSALTAIANDYAFDMVFAKQIRALGRSGDILLAISTSGNSPNVLEAIKVAHERNITVIALTGNTGGKIANLLTTQDILINVPHKRTARIQEVHILLIHALCDCIDNLILGDE